MRDRRKVHELLMERSLTEVETILDWAYGNPRWISWLVDGTMVERYFAQVSLDMRTKRARGPQHSGSHAAAAELTSVHDPDRPVAVSSGLAWRRHPVDRIVPGAPRRRNQAGRVSGVRLRPAQPSHPRHRPGENRPCRRQGIPRGGQAMTGMADAAPRSPEAWKSMGCCADFPQPWADLMWGLEFEDTHPLARVFRQAGMRARLPGEGRMPGLRRCRRLGMGLVRRPFVHRPAPDRPPGGSRRRALPRPHGALGPALGPVRRLAPSPSRGLRHGPGQGQHGTRATPMARRRPRPTQE